LWGTHAQDLTPRGLAALQRAMRHVDPDHPSSKQQIPSLDVDADESAAWQGVENQPESEPERVSATEVEPEQERPQQDSEQEQAQEQGQQQELETEQAQPEGWHFEAEAAPSAYAELEAEIEANAFAEPDTDSFPIDVLEAELEDARIDEERLDQRRSLQRRVEMPAELDFASNPIKPASRGINNPQVAMVVAVEYDVHHERQDPRFGYTRDLQIVQWTFMVSCADCARTIIAAADAQAKPNHPIFLDVLETATTEIMKRRLEGNAHDSWQSIVSRLISPRGNATADPSSTSLAPDRSPTPCSDTSSSSTVSSRKRSSRWRAARSSAISSSCPCTLSALTWAARTTGTRTIPLRDVPPTDSADGGRGT